MTSYRPGKESSSSGVLRILSTSPFGTLLSIHPAHLGQKALPGEAQPAFSFPPLPNPELGETGGCRLAGWEGGLFKTSAWAPQLQLSQ